MNEIMIVKAKPMIPSDLVKKMDPRRSDWQQKQRLYVQEMEELGSEPAQWSQLGFAPKQSVCRGRTFSLLTKAKHCMTYV